MTDVLLLFEVHQPYRIDENFYWQNRMFRRTSRDKFQGYYFDAKKDRLIFERATRKCYEPTTRIILDAIDRHKRGKKQVKVSFSLSGVFLEQCERFSPDVLEYFRQLARSPCAEFLEQTYFHSLSGLYPDRTEFAEQVRMHRTLLRELLGVEAQVFENTELLFNNSVAKAVGSMGYTAIYTEGAERILGNRSPNFVYAAKGCDKLRVLLRNYRLTDDIAFRFSSRDWKEWPLTAEKYTNWISSTPGQCISIFPDYETFGEHHWPETGIHQFLRQLLDEMVARDGLDMSIPSEAVKRHVAVDTIDVPELGGTVSWADIQRDASSWLGNAMQWAFYVRTRDMEGLVRESGDENFLRVWRLFQVSDHLHYMYTGGGGPGEVHSYFSPYKSPADAFITCQAALSDFEERLRLFTVAADSKFQFHHSPGEEGYTGVSASSLKGFVKALSKVESRSLEFHAKRGDFERWARTSLHDAELAKAMRQARELHGRKLRRSLVEAAKGRYEKIFRQFSSLGYY
jgi:alpha-amylase